MCQEGCPVERSGKIGFSLSSDKVHDVRGGDWARERAQTEIQRDKQDIGAPTRRCVLVPKSPRF